VDPTTNAGGAAAEEPRAWLVNPAWDSSRPGAAAAATADDVDVDVDVDAGADADAAALAPCR